MAREKSGLLAGPHTVPDSWQSYPFLSLSVVSYDGNSAVSVQSEREVLRTINTRENILEMVQRSPRLSTRKMASRICVSRMQVWRTFHEEDLYLYHDIIFFCATFSIGPGLPHSRGF